MSRGLMLEANVISVKEWMKTVSVAERVNGAGETKEGKLKLIVLEDPAAMLYERLVISMATLMYLLGKVLRTSRYLNLTLEGT